LEQIFTDGCRLDIISLTAQRRNLIVLFVVVAWAPAGGNDKDTEASTVRWAEGKPGCTFTRGDDGKYRYGLWSDDMGITLAVDSRELQRSHINFNPFLWNPINLSL